MAATPATFDTLDTLDILTSRGLSLDAIEARGYRRYASPADVVEADPRMGSDEVVAWRRVTRRELRQVREQVPAGWRHERGRWHRPHTLAGWTRHYGTRGPGFVMPKHALPGSPFAAPLPQLRPDAPVPDPRNAYEHDHADEYASRPLARSRHLAKQHGREGDPPAEGLHRHIPSAKYLLPPGPYGKRWDTNPLCADRFSGAERVLLHLEGCIKADALASIGEAVADVPSVTLWDRAGAVSWVDWPGGRPELRETGVETRGDFWEEFAEAEPALIEWEAELDRIAEAQAEELGAFLRDHVRAPVVVLCDSDWHINAAVATEAFTLRDRVRELGLPCVVAAPPTADDGSKQGTDDYLARGGTVEGHVLIEPRESPELAAFARDYARAQRNAGRVVRERLDFDLELLRWYATHAVAEGGRITRKVRAIARRHGVHDDTVKRATLRLRDAGALAILGAYHDPDAEHDRNGRRRRSPAPVLVIAEGLRPEQPSQELGDWLRAQG